MAASRKFLVTFLRRTGCVTLVAFVLGGALRVWLPRVVKEKRQAWTCLHLRSLARAVDGYTRNEGNPRHELPGRLDDSVRPPFGGPSLLQGGGRELIDVWGRPFRSERRRAADGAEYLLIWTAAPDGTPISQFGIGEREAFPDR